MTCLADCVEVDTNGMLEISDSFQVWHQRLNDEDGFIGVSMDQALDLIGFGLLWNKLEWSFFQLRDFFSNRLY